MSGPNARALARAHREAMRRRTRVIRRSVAVLAVTLFVLVFGIVYVRLTSGHDPALVAAARRRAASASRSQASERGAGEATGTGSSEPRATGSSESDGNSGSGEASGASSSENEPSGPSAVTTSQS